MRLLHRPRIKREIVEAPKFTLMVRAILAPGFKNDLQRFVQALPIVFPGDPENLVVHLGVARADAELKPAAGDRVDHRVVLGAVQRMAQRQDRNARTEMNFRSARGGCGKQHCRVGDRPAVAEKMVLVEHETFPAQLFSQRHLFKNLLVVDVVGRIDIRKIGRQDVDVKSHAAASTHCELYFRARRESARCRSRSFA